MLKGEKPYKIMRLQICGEILLLTMRRMPRTIEI